MILCASILNSLSRKKAITISFLLSWRQLAGQLKLWNELVIYFATIIVLWYSLFPISHIPLALF